MRSKYVLPEGLDSKLYLFYGLKIQFCIRWVLAKLIQLLNQAKKNIYLNLKLVISKMECARQTIGIQEENIIHVFVNYLNVYDELGTKDEATNSSNKSRRKYLFPQEFCILMR